MLIIICEVFVGNISVLRLDGKFSQMSYRKEVDHAVKLLLSVPFARDKIQAMEPGGKVFLTPGIYNYKR
jgi:hypothetical protein